MKKSRVPTPFHDIGKYATDLRDKVNQNREALALVRQPTAPELPRGEKHFFRNSSILSSQKTQNVERSNDLLGDLQKNVSNVELSFCAQDIPIFSYSFEKNTTMNGEVFSKSTNEASSCDLDVPKPKEHAASEILDVFFPSYNLSRVSPQFDRSAPGSLNHSRVASALFRLPSFCSESDQQLKPSSVDTSFVTRVDSKAFGEQANNLVIPRLDVCEFDDISALLRTDSNFEEDEIEDLLEDALFLGRGKQGIVYKAEMHSNKEKRLVVIKSSSFKKNPPPGLFFHQELTQHHRSSYDYNILRVYFLRACSNRAFMVLPYCESFLDKLMASFDDEAEPDDITHHLVNYSVIAQVMSDILEGLRYMHSFKRGDNAVGYVHRDIKPENIGLKNDGKNWHWVLCDLDTSEKIGNVNAPTAGTIKYMHPGCFSNKQIELSASNDIYQLGVVLLEMLNKAEGVIPPSEMNMLREQVSWKVEKFQKESTFAKGRMPGVYKVKIKIPKTIEDIKEQFYSLGCGMASCVDQTAIASAKSAIKSIKRGIREQANVHKIDLKAHLREYYGQIGNKKPGKFQTSFFRSYSSLESKLTSLSTFCCK